jgi:hypothetical protein
MPNSLTNIRSSAFYNCISLTNVTIGSGVTTIGSHAFAYSRVTSVTIPKSVTKIGANAFDSCTQLTNVIIGTGVTNIAIATFANCFGLISVTIPNNVTTIGDSAFANCQRLASVTVPNSVTNIGRYAFQSCYGLNASYFQGNAPLVNGMAGSADTSVFFGESGTAYYLPGTTGWGSTFGGWPTVLWNPQAKTGDGSFGIRTNQFGFNITGTANIPIVVEASPNLGGTWNPLLNGTITNGSIYFSDPQWTNYPSRFYRLRSP